MKKFIRGVALIAGGVIAASAAQADTIATFADPSPGPGFPMFVVNTQALTFTGGWSAAGLTLQTLSGDYPDAHMVFSGTSITQIPPAPVPPNPGSFQTGAGSIDFRQNITNNLLLHITFDSGFLNATNFGSADIFTGFNVVFSGPVLGYPVTNEAFSFSFANQVLTSNPPGFTTTASFTSSATIPAPGAAGLLGLGGLVAARRRRR